MKYNKPKSYNINGQKNHDQEHSILLEIENLIFQNDLEGARNLARTLSVPNEFNLEYVIIRAVVELGHDFDEFKDKLEDLLFPENESEGLFSVLKDLTCDRNWVRIEKLIKLTVHLLAYFNPSQKGIWMLYFLVLDYYMHHRQNKSVLITELSSITIDEYDDYRYFVFASVTIFMEFEDDEVLKNDLLYGYSRVQFIPNNNPSI